MKTPIDPNNTPVTIRAEKASRVLPALVDSQNTIRLSRDEYGKVSYCAKVTAAFPDDMIDELNREEAP